VLLVGIAATVSRGGLSVTGYFILHEKDTETAVNPIFQWNEE
jgi:hypothetical protein